MLISKPSPLLYSGAGLTTAASFATSSAGLFDGRSGGLASFLWPQDGGSVQFDVSFDPLRAISPRVFALVNIEGLRGTLAYSVDVALKQVGGAYDYLPLNVDLMMMPTGEVALLRVFDDALSMCEGARFTINDTSSQMQSGDVVSIGEVVVADAWQIAIDAELSDGWTQVAGENVSINGQFYLTPAPPGRSLKFRTAPATAISTYEAGSIAEAQASLAVDPRAVLVPDQGDTFIYENTWMYGRATRIGDKSFSRQSRRSQSLLAFDEMVGLSNV